MAKKILKVPQQGTQPANTLTPIDSMLQGAMNSNASEITPTAMPTSDKRPTSFNIDRNLFAEFKLCCTKQGLSMSSAVEQLIRDFITRH